MCDSTDVRHQQGTTGGNVGFRLRSAEPRCCGSLGGGGLVQGSAELLAVIRTCRLPGDVLFLWDNAMVIRVAQCRRSCTTQPEACRGTSKKYGLQGGERHLDAAINFCPAGWITSCKIQDSRLWHYEAWLTAMSGMCLL